MIVAVARPQAVMLLPSQHETIILAMDVSRSMRAADVQPNRLTAAQAAARRSSKTSRATCGSASCRSPAPPRSCSRRRENGRPACGDRSLPAAARDGNGSGLLVSLAQLLPDAGIDLESLVFDSAFSRYGGGAASLDKPRRDKNAPKKEHVAVAPGSFTSGAIILLSDGRRTTGPDPIEAAKLAADHGVRVYTVGFGTHEGGTIDGMEGWSFYVAARRETLKVGRARSPAPSTSMRALPPTCGKIYQSLGTSSSASSAGRPRSAPCWRWSAPR